MLYLRITLATALTLALARVSAAAETPRADEAKGEATEALENTVRWQTNDVDSRGYDVYRAEKEDGPFVKLTERPIDGRVRGKKGAFTYVDKGIEPGKVYWYYVEVTDLVGERRRFTPLIKSRAKGTAPLSPPAPPVP
jgi:hypothetical protein